MKGMFFTLLGVLFLSCSAVAQPTPDQLYGELFREVQMRHIFKDRKTFVDCIPKRPVKDIMYDYGLQKGPAMNLEKFVRDNFYLPPTPQANFVTQEKDVVEHINDLWNVLQRKPDATDHTEGTSLLPLPHPYIVPGGRFNEIYYWDSYFTMLGLKESGRADIIENMIENFAYLINKYGHIPNGNRTYYITRSQPPFFAMMVELLASIKGNGVYKKYLPALQKEYAYWMKGLPGLKAGEAKMCVVKMPNGDVLNRYWDESAKPRQESYSEDMHTADTFATNRLAVMRFTDAAAAARAEKEFKEEAWHHLRAGAASGWDFSSRWFEDEQSINTIRTTEFVPVDLNVLLYQLETTIAKAAGVQGNKSLAASFQAKAKKRAALIIKYCWNSQAGFFADYDFANLATTNRINAAGMFPFAVLPTALLASKIKPATAVLKAQLLKEGGIVTTTKHSGQQWDAPNGWAPLQWMGILGLDRNGQKDLAKEVASRWVNLNVDVFNRTGKLMEKYNVENTHLETGGGEYPNQDGFGWTNGTLLALKKKYGL